MIDMLEWMVTSSVLILVVLALRGLLKEKLSARLRYALWAMVLVRLLVPVQLFTVPVNVGQATLDLSKRMEAVELYAFQTGKLDLPEQDVQVMMDSVGPDSSFLPSIRNEMSWGERWCWPLYY